MIDDENKRAIALNRVQDIVRQVVDDPEVVITESTRADDVRGWDSLTNAHIIIATEKLFRIRLKASEVAQLENVGSLLDIILARGTI
jgi:acyl carrier protein